jgi:hypothetical protein
VSALDATPSADEPNGVLDLPAPYMQLLFACGVGSGIFTNPDLRARLTEAILSTDLGSVRKNKALTSLGLCPGYLKLLTESPLETADSTSTRKVQDWAHEVIKGCAVRPIRCEEWQELGLDAIWLSLLSLQGVTQKETGKSRPADELSETQANPDREETLKRWRAILMLLESGCLASETVEKAVLQPGKNNLIVIVAGSLGSRDPGKPIPGMMRARSADSPCSTMPSVRFDVEGFRGCLTRLSTVSSVDFCRSLDRVPPDSRSRHSAKPTLSRSPPDGLGSGLSRRRPNQGGGRRCH